MRRNISVDELIKFLNPESEYVFYDDTHGFCINTQDVLDHLCAMPSADVQTVVHGEWIPVDSYSAFGGDEATWMAHGNPVAFYYCSHCKEQAYAGEDGESLITEYCPNCGAKMDGKGADNG